MDARFFDMLHDATDNDCFAVGDGIDVNLYGFLEKLIYKDRML